MSTFVNKTKSGVYSIGELQREINASALIVPSCLSITGSDTDLILEFAAELDGAEDAELDAIILAHVEPAETINVSTLTFSELDGKKLAVHTSYKPLIDGSQCIAQWTGAGDDIAGGIVGGGELLHFVMSGPGSVSKNLEFLPTAGRVWLHEGYLKFVGGGEGDSISATIVAPATSLQQSVNLDLVMDGNDVKYSQGGPGTGTHGFAAAPILIPRPFQKDGGWDYNGVSLTPNFGNTGLYKICDIEVEFQKYINKIPCYGDCATYFSMTSDETAELVQPYFLRITCDTVSNNDWHASVIMEIYRERTI